MNFYIIFIFLLLVLNAFQSFIIYKMGQQADNIKKQIEEIKSQYNEMIDKLINMVKELRGE